MEDFKKKYVVAEINGVERLCKVKRGYFASDSWFEKGNFDDVAGAKFGIVDGSDGEAGWISKSNIHALKDEVEFAKLYKDTCEAFQIRDYIEEAILPNKNKGNTYWKAYIKLDNIPLYVEKGFTSEEIISYFEEFDE